MPTSVLLAVLAAAGLLALAPALVRRHDATERQVAERSDSAARVLTRRRPRSVPGRRPLNPSRVHVPTLRGATPAEEVVEPEGGTAHHATRERRAAHDRRTSDRVHEPPRAPAERGRRGSDRDRSPTRSNALAVVPRSAPPAQPSRPRTSPAVYRRRRVLAALALLNLVELVGVLAVGPGFWVGFAVTGTLLLAYLAHLRTLAVADRRRRRADARRSAAVAARQAEVRREQERRSAARRETARRMAEQRESLRRAPPTWSVSPTVSYRPAAGPRRSQAS